ncbi:phosphotransferase family protein [Caenimonas aquaedulcis]|uniref:Phosphotransferase family protein n=1 Tax=Caenimonas aquaedulcis TaxID=2793270 RepID=A0A931H3Y6_9BURK|nr:phosphotransferase family protein [Caenimonas aquaedulcis]MBG9388058.1 phosphotransferase family protein [Caenimonas aquaedulcis]
MPQTRADLQARLQDYLQGLWHKPVRVRGFRRFPVGLSWTTIGLTAEVGEGNDARTLPLVLRLGDPGGLFAPYTARPEYLALQAFADVPALPVARVHGYSDDETILGAPFMVADLVAGDTPMPWRGAGAADGAQVQPSLAQDFADALAAIHAFDWRRGGLDGLAGNVPASEVARHQVRHWARHAGLGEDGAHPQMHYAQRWLEANAPQAEHVTVVHGDYRVGNFLQQDGRITAILDWETVHLGDPHEDLAWAQSRTFAAGTARVGGLFDREAFHSRYQERSGIRIRPAVLRYYDVMVQFKMCAIQIGAQRRVDAGRASDVRMAVIGFQVAPALMELNRLIGELP